jgi:hypothetical protein
VGLPGFHIEIVTQGWLGPNGPVTEDPEAAVNDLCSHGDIRLVIAGQTIASGDDGGYGISEAALGLLRTITSNRTRSPVKRPGSWTGTAEEAQKLQRLIPHGCGLILMLNCPIGIDWTVEHASGRVRISEVFRCDDTLRTAVVQEYPDVAVEVPLEEYRDEIVAFARRAKEPFEGITKSFGDDFEREMFAEFWEEYDRLLADAVAASKS